MTLEFTPAIEQKLGALAAQRGNTPVELAPEVIDCYLQHVAILTREVRKAEEEADRDGWLTSEEVAARIERRSGKSEQRSSGPNAPPAPPQQSIN